MNSEDNKLKQEHQKLVEQTKAIVMTEMTEITPERIQFLAWEDTIDFVTSLGTRLDEEVEGMALLEKVLKTPKEYEGIFKIQAGSDLIYWVEDGEIVQDSYELAKRFQQQNKIDQPSNLEVVKRIMDYVEIVGQSQPDGSKIYDNDSYSFTLNKAQVSVKSKKENAEILNNDGFTSDASQKDMANMYIIKDKVEEVKSLLQREEVQQIKPNLKLRL